MTDDEFITALETCRLTAAEFDHAAHVRAGYLYLRQHTFAHAAARLCTAICGFAHALGKVGLYHETVTMAFMALIQERMYLGGDRGGWEGFARMNPDLFDRDALLAYYPRAVLDSAEARSRFMLPPGGGRRAASS